MNTPATRTGNNAAEREKRLKAAQRHYKPASTHEITMPYRTYKPKTILHDLSSSDMLWCNATSDQIV